MTNTCDNDECNNVHHHLFYFWNTTSKDNDEHNNVHHRQIFRLLHVENDYIHVSLLLAFDA